MIVVTISLIVLLTFLHLRTMSLPFGLLRLQLSEKQEDPSQSALFLSLQIFLACSAVVTATIDPAVGFLNSGVEVALLVIGSFIVSFVMTLFLIPAGIRGWLRLSGRNDLLDAWRRPRAIPKVKV